MSELSPLLDEKQLLCCSCGGYPIDDGAVFVAVFYISKGKRELGGMCELCYLKRLKKRGHAVNISSGPTWQIDMPELGIHAMNHPKRR